MGSTAAGAVGNIASGAANALFGGIQARRNWKYKQKEMALQQKYNLENMQKQFDYQQEAWNRENRYNDPRNASARWRLAGISPNAVFGNSPGGAGVAGSAGTPDVSNPSAGGNVDTSTYHPTLTPVEMMRAQNEKKVADSQADLNNALANKARGDTKDPDITKRSQLVQLSRDEIAKETEEVQRDILKIQKIFAAAKEANDVAIQRAKFLEIIANCNKLLADKNVSKEMMEKLEADKKLAQEMVNTEKAKQRNLDSQTETENQIREGRKSLTDAQAKEALSRAGLNKLARDRDSYEFFLRLVNADDVNSPAQAVSKFVRMFKSRFNRDLADYQKAALSDYLEKIWSGEMP
nr:MAG TPA: hypothetical protein [Microviridae sp.]